MSSANIFPDQIYIEQIRKRLWCGREFGRAAVMVGAGFSQNAEKISKNTPSMPLWNDLARFMYNSLHLPGTFSEEDRKKAINSSNSLNLANTYEKVFGREALDNLLLQSIPDTKYLPGRLHKLLLSLPWSDIFTTNYDTLLERTQKFIYERKYDLVLTQSDIPRSMRPRIVKLHGSFPSYRPFIITKKDYKSYPKNFAPFINMVQQSIMENAFCLIGFSGRDPNFSHWIKWVHRNLGSSAPPIYLCGLLDLRSSKKQKFKKQNIFSIDLSIMFPKSDWPNPNVRNEKALEWFLLNLMYGAPPNIMAWPIPSSGRIWKPSDGLPSVPINRSVPLSKRGEIAPHVKQTYGNRKKDLVNISKIWHDKRMEYPGWIVAPEKNREEIWRYTEQWINPILFSINELTPPKNLFLLYELNWRLEISLTPLFIDWVNKIVPIIETFNPYPHLIKIKRASIRPDKKKYRQMDWETIGEYWVELAFALAREAREDQDEERFRLWMDRLKKIAKEKAEWKAHWFYEECLFHLFRFDQVKIRKTLKNWEKKKESPFWETKRASILAEIGELEEAESIAEDALSEIRLRIQPYSPDFTLLSQEGWTMMLLEAVKNNKWSAKSNFLDLYRDRWEKLGNYHCNPWPELELLTSVVEKTPPAPALTERIEKGFDPGRLTIAHHFYSGLHIISDIRPAFAFLRILEEGALPPTCGMVSMFPDAIVSAAKWIAPFAPLWALSSLIRSGEIKGPEWLFSRARVAVLSQNNVDHFYALFTNSLTQGMQYLNGITPRDTMLKARFSRQQLEISAESLSRICFRFSPAQIDKLFKLAVDMYNLPFFYKYDLSPRDSLKTLFKRLLYVMPQAEILKRIFKLLSLPIPTEMGFEVGVPQTWIEPFNYIKWLENTKLSPNFDRSAWDAPIENLLRIVKNGTAEARKRASLRLAKLYEINALSDKETKTFSQALWSRVDSKKHLPSDTYFYDYSFLRLPENKKGEAKENFRKYLLSVNFPRVLEHSTTPGGKWKTTHLSVGSQDNRYIKELLASTAPLFPKDEKEKQKYVDWTLNEVVQMLEKAVAWWDEEKVDLNTNLFVRDLKKRFSFLVQLMSKVILPRLSSARKEVKDLAMKLLTEMGKSDICILSALPMTLFINPDSYDEVVQKMQNGLNSKKQEEIRDSLSGFLRWSFYSNKKKICAPPPILLDKIIDRVASRRQPGLNSVIELISTIVRRFPELLNEKQIKSLLTALDKLIEETKIPKFQDQWEMDNVPMIIPIDNRPEYRKLAAELAYYLFNQLQKEGGKISPVLRKWKEICRNDSLPEVKKVWQ